MSFHNVVVDNNILTFDVYDIDVSIINSLRRIILAEIPNVAVAFDQLSDKNKDMIIYINNTALHNEYLGHRLSLVPMCFSQDEIENFNSNNYRFKLHVQNTGTEIISVTTNDIEIYDENEKLYDKAFHKRIFPKNPLTGEHVLITKLRPNIYHKDKGEELKVDFTATKNIAKTHSRWCPVSCCTFYNVIDEKAAKEGFNKLLEGHENLSETEKKSLKNRFETLDKYRFYKVNGWGEPNAFHFKIESECALTPTYIFTKSLDVLIDKLKNMIDNISSYPVNLIHDNQSFYECIIQDEDYTLLNVFQAITYNMEIRDKESTVLEYIGYYQPHPLDNKMILKLKFKNDYKGDVRSFLANAAGNIITEVTKYKDQWIAAL